MTGKVAALGIISKERGQAEFDRFLKRFRHFHSIKNNVWYRFIRPNVSMLERGIRILGTGNVERLGSLIPSGRLPVRSAVPGFSYMSCN